MSPRPPTPNLADSLQPEDWAALWQQLLQARQTPFAARPSKAWLQLNGQHGWQLSAACSPHSAAWFQVYKPLLDARQSTASAPDGPSKPWVLAQLGQSLDGCVATASGDAYFVTGPESLLHLHRLRALCDAVLVGAGTVAIDNPQLTTRHVPGPHPLRVVLDPAARLDGRARLFHDGAAPTWWLCDRRHAEQAQARLAGAPAQVLAEVVAIDGLLADEPAASGPDMARAMAALAARGVRVLLVEGGGVTVSRCLAAGVLDRLHLVVAPVLIGSGRRGLQHTGPLRMVDCPRPPVQRLALGDDLLWDLDLQTPTTRAVDPAPGTAVAG